MIVRRRYSKPLPVLAGAPMGHLSSSCLFQSDANLNDFQICKDKIVGNGQ